LPAVDAPGRPGSAGSGPPLEPAELRRIKAIAYWLDERFRIPGTNIRIGIDGLAGLVPGIGDAATTLIALYIVAEAYRLGLPPRAIARMLTNVGLDFMLGSIPLLGDIFDVAFKANRRNVRLLLEQLERLERDRTR